MTNPELACVLTPQIAFAFPTLIGQFPISNTETTNAALLQLLLDREATAPSDDFANQGGYHSSGDLLDWPSPAVNNLKTWISQALTYMVQATSQLPEVQGRMAAPRGGFRLSAWGNISRKGNYHRMHNHPGNAWSGVYYVASNSHPGSMGGVLELYDSRPFTEMVETPGSPYGQRVHIRPTPGLMVLFPSWLYHFVHPSDNDELRVSIAFNAAWQSS